MCIMFSRNIEPTILKQCKRNRKSTLSHPWLHQPRSRHLPSRLLFPSRQRLCRETYGISGRTGLVEIQIELNIVRQDRSAIPCLLPPPITSRAVPRERKLFCLIFLGLPRRSTLSWGPFKFRRRTRITFALDPLVHLRCSKNEIRGKLKDSSLSSNLPASTSNHD